MYGRPPVPIIAFAMFTMFMLFQVIRGSTETINSLSQWTPEAVTAQAGSKYVPIATISRLSKQLSSLSQLLIGDFSLTIQT